MTLIRSLALHWARVVGVAAVVCWTVAPTQALAQQPVPADDEPVELEPEPVEMEPDPVDLAPEVVDLPPEPVGDPGEALDLSPDLVVEPAELEALLSEGVRLMEDDRLLEAAPRFHDIVNNGEFEWGVVQDASYFLGVVLQELGLHQSALVQFESVVDTGPDHPKYRKSLPWLLFIARNSPGDNNVLARIASYPPELYPPDFAHELHFLVGQFHYSEGSYDDALARFHQVGEDNDEFFVRARYLEGVIHVQESQLATDPENVDTTRLKRAADAFKDILRFQRDAGSGATVDRVAGMANLALGRLSFSTRQYQVSVRYYDQVDEADADWLQSLFELSWVYFQLKNYPRALGNLHTLNSPYFADQYFPESRVLQALILFYNCRYDEANAIIKAFVQDYYPLMTELRDQINQFADPNAFYGWLARLSRSEQTEFSARYKRIFNAALADRKLRRKFFFVKTLNQEIERLGALAGTTQIAAPLLDGLKGELTAYRSLVIGEAGSLAQARLLRLLKELKQHLAGALKIKGETLKAQRGALAESVQLEQAAAAAAQTEIVVDAEHFEWPFTGEYWRDELGSYMYDISSECGIPAGGTQ